MQVIPTQGSVQLEHPSSLSEIYDLLSAASEHLYVLKFLCVLTNQTNLVIVSSFSCPTAQAEWKWASCLYLYLHCMFLSCNVFLHLPSCSAVKAKPSFPLIQPGSFLSLFGAADRSVNISPAVRPRVTGHPIIASGLQLNPLGSHQLSNAKLPRGSIDPADPLVVIRGKLH